jgi:spoIIIJ-associated protein
MDDQTVQDAPEQQDAAPKQDYELIARHYEDAGVLSDAELDTVADVAVRQLRAILKCFGEEGASIDEFEGDEGELILDVSEGNLAVLIGRHGSTLDAVQLLVSSLTTKELGFHYPVVVDIEGYKDRRKQKLSSMARSAAARAKRQHAPVRLAPMNAYERRLVHLALSKDDSVETHSEGEDPRRCVVITAR